MILSKIIALVYLLTMVALLIGTTIYAYNVNNYVLRENVRNIWLIIIGLGTGIALVTVLSVP